MAQKDIIDKYEYDVIYDTETSKKVEDWGIPSDDPSHPHIVSLAAVKCERKTGNIVGAIDLVMRQDGWETTEEAFNVHGISKEYSLKVGVNELTAVLLFVQFCENSMRVCYNQTFDQRIVRICLKRNRLLDAAEEWSRKDNHACAMIMSKWIMRLPPFGKFGPRNPKLTAAFKHFTGNELDGAHGAMIDTMAAKTVFYSIVNANGGKIFLPGGKNEPVESGDDSEALFSDQSNQDVLRTFDLEDDSEDKAEIEPGPIDQDDPY